jgi:ADP-ribose pyrophosphatase YjhB (NUDIX family)
MELRNAISFVVYDKTRKKFLIVQRPANDDNLPNVWGLPAGSLKTNETFEDAIYGALKEKLGVEGKIIKYINEGSLDRSTHRLFMKLYEVEIIKEYLKFLKM